MNKLPSLEWGKNRRVRKISTVIAGLGMLAGASSCHAAPSGLPPATVLVHQGDVEITAGEYDSIVFAATKFNLPVDRFGKLALCESGMDSNVMNSLGYGGLFSQGRQYWQKRVAHYIKVTGENPGSDIFNPLSNALVSAQMIAERQNSSFSRSHNGLPSDWQECYSGWQGTYNKSQFWGQATVEIMKRNPLNEQALGDIDQLYQASSDQFALTA